MCVRVCVSAKEYVLVVEKRSLFECVCVLERSVSVYWLREPKCLNESDGESS